MFPDGYSPKQVSWCGCCIQHDLAYWRGGTALERLHADQRLADCVQQQTGSKTLADLMYEGVRIGGQPYSLTHFRWGYGWPLGRFYQPLTSAEKAVADQLEQQYLAQPNAMSCPVF